MTTAHDQFLERVRNAVTSGARAGQSTSLAARGAVGYQGAAADPVSQFCDALTAAGGLAHCVPSQGEAVQIVMGLVRRVARKRIVLGKGKFIDVLGLENLLQKEGIGVLSSDGARKDDFFAADMGITGVRALVSETGTVVLSSGADEPRSFSLLPPVHIAVAERSQLVPDLFDLFDASSQWLVAPLPSCLTLVTGPSKTGDIELKLVTGVHGPGELHVVLVTG